MGENSEIAWCDHTHNPWWGCARVSPGCENCYAEAQAARFGTKWGTGAERRFFGDRHWNDPVRWNKAAMATGVRARVFCASMADAFEDRRDLDEHRTRLWKLIEATPYLDWLLLTKRPENMLGMLPESLDRTNVWLGTTVEDQKRADARIPHLLVNKAAVHFLSYEPALGPVDFSGGLALRFDRCTAEDTEAKNHEVDPCAGCDPVGHNMPGGYKDECGAVFFPRVNWIIVGGESGSNARPFNLQWARNTVAQCKKAGVAVFVKQLGADPYQHGPTFSLTSSDKSIAGISSKWEYPISDAAGRNMSDWPEELRIREMPRPPQPQKKTR